MTKDIKDISEKELTKLYDEYQAALGRPVPAVVHRQGRSIPGCVSTEASGFGNPVSGTSASCLIPQVR
jgi:hypothetical protein